MSRRLRALRGGAVRLSAALSLGLATSGAAGEGAAATFAPRAGALQPHSFDSGLPRAESELAARLASFADVEPFGARGSRRLQVHSGYAIQPDQTRNQLGLAGLGVSYFIIDHLSLDAELNGLFIHQRGDDAVAGNLNLFFRWHFIVRDEWSGYVDIGTGMMLANRRVPDDGSRFNFTPQMGAGLTFDLGEGSRLLTGVRWHHISNANLYSDNPGRDSVYAYVGLSFGF